jgi:predicted phage terminase large subunit-like protein
MMIDDPIKSREQAESASYRDKVWHWFNDDMLTRLEPDASVILIQTRWHEDDLAGRLLKQQQEEGGEEWHVISLPAICEAGAGTLLSPSAVPPPKQNADEITPLDEFHNKLKTADNPTGLPMGAIPKFRQRNYGDVLREREEAKREETLNAENARNAEAQKHLTVDADQKTPDIPDSASSANSAFNIPVDPLGRLPGEALWPQRFDIKWLERTKRRMGTYSFAALYQQRPVPAEGGMFKRSWFTIVPLPPPNLNWKRGYDLSFAANPESDPSAILKVAYDKDGVLYIDGCFIQRLPYPLQRKMLLHYIQTETRTEHGIELSANGHALLQDLRRMRELRGRRFRGVRVDADKITRALPWIALAEEGRVRLVAGSWNEEFIREACAFPHGTRDDQIDAVSIAVRMHGDRSGRGFWKF